MIKKIEIKNFESHSHTVYDNLSAGLNLFRGESDSGKSSAFRAVCVCAYNRWNEEMLRIGEDFSEIYIETEKGSVLVRRGGGKNEWSVEEKTPSGIEKKFFEKVGKTVPDAVTRVLGMPRMDVAGVKETPNMMFQLDKHYMISEVDGKRCSANMIAQIIDEVVGLTGTEKLINDMSLDGKRTKKEVKDNEEELKRLSESIHDEKEVGRKRGLVEDCQKLYSKFVEKQNRHLKMCDVNDRFVSILNRKKDIEEEIKGFVGLNDSLEKYASLRDKSILHKKYTEFFDKTVLLNNKVLVCNEKLSEMPDFIILSAKILKLKNLQKKYDRIVAFRDEYAIKSAKVQSLDRAFTKASEELNKVSKEWGDFRKEYPNCPLCGALLKEEVCCK